MDERVVRAALAGEADVARANVLHYARRGEHEVDEVAAVRRQVLNRLLVDDGRHFRARRLDERRGGGDRESLRHTLLHLDRERGVAADVDGDLLQLQRLKTDSSPLTLYVPGGSSASSKWPFSLLTVVRVAPVALFCAVTVTPGRAPPESSLTVPEIEPLLLCANAANGASVTSRIMRKKVKRICFE